MGKIIAIIFFLFARDHLMYFLLHSHFLSLKLKIILIGSQVDNCNLRHSNCSKNQLKNIIAKPQAQANTQNGKFWTKEGFINRLMNVHTSLVACAWAWGGQGLSSHTDHYVGAGAGQVSLPIIGHALYICTQCFMRRPKNRTSEERSKGLGKQHLRTFNKIIKSDPVIFTVDEDFVAPSTRPKCCFEFTSSDRGSPVIRMAGHHCPGPSSQSPDSDLRRVLDTSEDEEDTAMSSEIEVRHVPQSSGGQTVMMVTSGQESEAKTHPMELRPKVTRGQTVVTPCSGGQTVVMVTSHDTEVRAQVPVISGSHQGHFQTYPVSSVPIVQQVFTGLNVPKMLGLQNHPIIGIDMQTQFNIRYNRKEIEGLLKAVDGRHRGGDGHHLTIKHNAVMAAGVKLAADCDPRNHALIIHAACQAMKCSHHSDQPPSPTCPCQVWMTIQRNLGLTYSSPPEFKKGRRYIKRTSLCIFLIHIIVSILSLHHILPKVIFSANAGKAKKKKEMTWQKPVVPPRMAAPVQQPQPSVPRGLAMIKEEPVAHYEAAAAPHQPLTVNNVNLTLGPSGHAAQSSGPHVYPPPAVKFAHVRTPEGVLTSYPHIMVNAGDQVQELAGPSAVMGHPPMVTQPPAMVASMPMVAPPPPLTMSAPPPAPGPMHQPLVPVQEYIIHPGHVPDGVPDGEYLLLEPAPAQPQYSQGPSPLMISHTLMIDPMCQWGMARSADGEFWRLAQNSNPSSHIYGDIESHEEAERILERHSRSNLPWSNWCDQAGSSIVFHLIDSPVTPYSLGMEGRPLPVVPPDLGLFWSYSPTSRMVYLFPADAIREDRELWFAGYRICANQPAEWKSFVFRFVFAHARRLYSEQDMPGYNTLPQSYREAQSHQLQSVAAFLEMPVFENLREMLFKCFLHIPQGLAMIHAASRVSNHLPAHWLNVTSASWGHKTAPGPGRQAE